MGEQNCWNALKLETFMKLWLNRKIRDVNKQEKKKEL